MLILSRSSKLRLLEGTLRRHLPETLPVLGAVMTINHRNPAGYEVLVDSWPEFKAVLTRPYRDVPPLSHCAAPGGMGELGGLQDGVYEACRDISVAKGVQLEASRYFTYLHLDPSSMPEIRLDPAVRLSSLDISHTDLLKETWVFGGNDRSRRYLTSLIRYFPSICLMDAAHHPGSLGNSSLPQ
ncbi:Glycine N-acyltransferase-like protein 3 [Chelonia mydas]|uniref:Glycine N-acyltransferase-like protein n=1 Tax=Chelonia mydas TaxID=8469 RepID=M7C5L6_CHEMY|nr:Glycine N-acyltransferase-like protein 3 [Chelonia mydas]